MIDNKFIVVVPVYNSDKYIEECLSSILNQSYKKYSLIIVDDCSTDNTEKNIVNACRGNDNVKIIRNKIRNGSASGNIAETIKTHSKDEEDIIITIDGDDFLYGTDVFSYLNTVYQDDNIYMTYGQFVPISKSYGKFCKPITNTRTYRKSGQWNASHLRTFKTKLWNKLNDDDLRDAEGKYFKVAGDASYMYPLIELCGNKHIKFIDKILYVYNDISPNNDMKIYRDAQLNTATMIRNKIEYNELITKL